MKAYAIAAETIHDEAMFAEYRKQVVDTVKPFGGQFIARGGKLTVLEVSGNMPAPSSLSFRHESPLKAGINRPTTKR